MTINYLEHFLIYAKDIELTKKFYIEVLGLKEGYRPQFKFPGYWLYLNNIPVVHLVNADITDKAKADYLPPDKQKAYSENSSAVNHIAFNASHLNETLEHLGKLQITLLHRIVPEENSHQIFIQDPNGVMIELNFRT